MSSRSIYRKIAGLVSIISIFTLCANSLSEAVVSTPLQAHADAPAAGDYIYVNSNGYDGSSDYAGCHIFNTSTETSYPPDLSSYIDSSCNLGEAINLLNSLGGVGSFIAYHDTLITIRIADGTTPIQIDRNLPTITYPGQVIFDGQQGTGSNRTKAVLQDTSSDSAQLDYFFRVAPEVTLWHQQDITITNFAFTGLKKNTAAAITTDDPSTTFTVDNNQVMTNFDSSYIENIAITNNYFGTTDGTTISSTNHLSSGIKLSLYQTSVLVDTPATYSPKPNVTIQNNNLYNTTDAITVSAGTAATLLDTNVYSCKDNLELEEHSTIDHNTIGQAINGTINPGDALNATGWLGKAIFACHLHNVNISENTIANTNKNVLLAGLVLNTAIYLKNSTAVVKDNSIGTNSSSASNDQLSIIGNGITLEKDYNDSSRSFITGNKINNLRRPGSALVCSNNSTRYNPENSTSTICGGTGVLLEGSNNNWIYNNRIGSNTQPNQGYGISIEGSLDLDNTENATVTTFNTSNSNKISGNAISYNQADGVHIGYITGITSFTCTGMVAGHSEHTNNCENSITENRILRNGTSSGNTNGGIGIDLKGFHETEQKNTSASTANTGGSNNDTDITTDQMDGPNGIINAPFLATTPPLGAPQGSNQNEVHGVLSAPLNSGKYWVEVYQVQCPAETASTTLYNTETLASQNCDTDSPSSAEQNLNHTYGQGAYFVCGTLVEKQTTSDLGSWSCRPDQFGQTISSGLLTATVSEVKAPASGNKISYNQIDTITPAIPVASNSFIAQPVRYSCALAQLIFTNLTDCTSSNTNNGVALSAKGNILVPQFLGNTSEFAQNIYIPGSQIDITKTVSTCSSNNPTSCNTNYSSSTSAAAGSFVDFRIVINSASSNSSPVLAQFYDALPTSLALVPNTCVSQTNTGTVPARSAIHTSCTFTNSQIDFNGLNPGQNVVLYYMAEVANDSRGTLHNVGIVNVDGFTADQSQADITISGSQSTPPTSDTQNTPSFTIQKSISTPNTSGNPLNGTVVSNTTAQTVNYTIVATATGFTNSTVSSLQLQDNFPHGSINNFYDANTCIAHITVGSNASTTVPCENRSTINNAAETPVTIISGNQILNSVDGATINANDTIEVDVSYSATVAANLLTSGSAEIPLNNTATWGQNTGSPEARHFSSAGLTIRAPGSESNNNVTITKLVRTCTTNALTSCTSANFNNTLSSVSAGSTVEYRIDVSNPSTTTTTLSITDVQPANMTFVRDSGACQIFHDMSAISSITGNRPTGGSACTFNSNQLQNSISISGGHHTYVYILATIASSFNGSIVNQAQITSGCTSNCLSQASITTTTANPQNPTPTNPSALSITKHADNNVTGTDHSNEKVYKPGDTVNYTLTISNNGATANNVAVQDVINSQIGTITGDNLPSGVTLNSSNNTNAFSGISVASGGTPTTLNYHGTIASRSSFDLDQFDLNENTDLQEDDDFYANPDSDIPDENITSTNNSHRHIDDILGSPDGKFVSLGQNGNITIDLGDKVIVNGSGDDFALLPINNNTDDTDQENESIDVEVSQNGTTFKKVSSSEDDYHYDIRKARMSWVKYIKITDTSSSTKAKAPGVDLDAICLFNIGVRLGNQATLTSNNAFATENIVVDVTNVFKHKLTSDNCTEENTSTPTLVSPPELVAPPVDLPPPAPTPLPKPKTLPKTGTGNEGLLLIAISSGVSWIALRLKKKSK